MLSFFLLRGRLKTHKSGRTIENGLGLDGKLLYEGRNSLLENCAIAPAGF
jgi:hypothetical protein